MSGFIYGAPTSLWELFKAWRRGELFHCWTCGAIGMRFENHVKWHANNT